jgi:hypothetical protein
VALKILIQAKPACGSAKTDTFIQTSNTTQGQIGK